MHVPILDPEAGFGIRCFGFAAGRYRTGSSLQARCPSTNPFRLCSRTHVTPHSNNPGTAATLDRRPASHLQSGRDTLNKDRKNPTTIYPARRRVSAAATEATLDAD